MQPEAQKFFLGLNNVCFDKVRTLGQLIGVLTAQSQFSQHLVARLGGVVKMHASLRAV